MYNKKYILEYVEEFNGHNPTYDKILGTICYPVYFNVNERGWFLYETGIRFDPPHRVHTSVVKDILEYPNQIIVTTQNTRFTFTLV